MNKKIALALLLTLSFTLSGIMTATAADSAAGQKAAPQQEQSLEKHTNSIGMEFVLIPAGSFTRTFTSKTDAGEEKTESAVVITKPFYLSTHLVTQEQWTAVMGKNPSSFKGENNPVDTVSWNDAQEFIKRLNAKEKHARYRLPTEAEWELAVRAGTKTPFFFLKDPRNWENALDEVDAYAWVKKNSGDKTHPVGRKEPNAYGLYDMYGNAWEWVQDGYDELPTAPEVKDYCASVEDSLRVLRGGCWMCSPDVIRAGNRRNSPADRGDNHMGFRLALSLE